MKLKHDINKIIQFAQLQEPLVQINANMWINTHTLSSIVSYLLVFQPKKQNHQVYHYRLTFACMQIKHMHSAK